MIATMLFRFQISCLMFNVLSQTSFVLFSGALSVGNPGINGQGLSLPLNASILPANATLPGDDDNDSKLNFVQYISEVIDYIKRYSRKQSIDLYQVEVQTRFAGKTKTKNIDAISFVVLNFRASDDTCGYIVRTGNDRRLDAIPDGLATFKDWGVPLITAGPSIGPPVDTAPMVWSDSTALTIHQTFQALQSSKNPNIPQGQRDGPWSTVTIKRFPKPLPGFGDNNIYRIHRVSDESDLAFPYLEDVYIDASNSEAIMLPPSRQSLPKNPWGFGEDNRYSKKEIGPYKDLEYLAYGVHLVRQTMGNGYYRDAELIQVKIQRMPSNPPKVENYQAFILFFKWTNPQGELKLLRFMNVVSLVIEGHSRSGGLWTYWDIRPQELDWADARETIHLLEIYNPAPLLLAMDIADVQVPLFDVWDDWVKKIGTGWSTPEFYLSRPQDSFFKRLNRKQIIYDFPEDSHQEAAVVGAATGRFLVLKNLPATSNGNSSSNLTAAFVEAS